MFCFSTGFDNKMENLVWNMMPRGQPCKKGLDFPNQGTFSVDFICGHCRIKSKLIDPVKKFRLYHQMELNARAIK